MTINITDNLQNSKNLISVYVGEMASDVTQSLKNNSGGIWATGSVVHTWKKPPGCKFIHIFIQGGGSGGAGGAASPSGYYAGGGSGGSSGGSYRTLVPASLMPENLYVIAGGGGLGGSGGFTDGINVSSATRGFPGGASLVSYSPFYYNNALYICYTNIAGSSNFGTSSAGGSAPNVALAWNAYKNKSIGLDSFLAENRAVSHDTGIPGNQAGGGYISAIPFPFDMGTATGMIAGGAGGGGATSALTSFRGGYASQMGTFELTSYTSNYSTINLFLSAGISGSDGRSSFGIGFHPYHALNSINMMNFLSLVGGSGGGGNVFGNGGNGGLGSYGCGGGGGGGTVGTNVFGGNGGNGGPGFVIIQAIM